MNTLSVLILLLGPPAAGAAILTIAYAHEAHQKHQARKRRAAMRRHPSNNQKEQG